MAQVRIRLEIDQGIRGVRLSSLAQIADQTQKFLRMVAEDVRIESLGKEWIATDFHNSALSFNLESTGEADEEQAVTYRRAVSAISAYKPDTPPAMLNVRNETLVQYARISDGTASGELLRMGIFDNGVSPVPTQWLILSKQQAAGILEYFEDRIDFSGVIHGIIHSLYKESQPPYFDVRDISTGQLVRCFFTEAHYDAVWKMLKKKDAVIVVQGEIQARRADRRIEGIKIARMEEAPGLTEEQFNAFFGSAPTFTGKLSTSQFINRTRRHARE